MVAYLEVLFCAIVNVFHSCIPHSLPLSLPAPPSLPLPKFRGQTVGLYLTSTPEACFNIATSSNADIIVVENDAQLQKILQVHACRFQSDEECLASQ